MSCQIITGEYLFLTKDQCCACGVCKESCNQDAIFWKTDSDGFVYPQVDQARCVGCGRCVKSCPYHGEIQKLLHSPRKCYAGINQSKQQRLISASGGAFAAIAQNFIERGGVVYGAAMEISDDAVSVKHIGVERLEDLKRLQGSKYIQSNAAACYKSMQENLRQRRKVLFSGTPCQVSGVKRAFERYTENLYTVDLICHGVPSQAFFNVWLRNLVQKQDGTLTNFVFRDKQYGWGYSGSCRIKNNKNEVDIKINPDKTFYYRWFLTGEIFRESCYHCPYATPKRSGDLTVGDFWGIQIQSPELLKKNGGPLLEEEGVSCIMLNTDKGQELLQKSSKNLFCVEIEYAKIRKQNSQLNYPSRYSGRRKKIFRLYEDKGYKALEEQFVKWQRQDRIKRCLVSKMPKELKQTVKSFFHKP